MAQPISTQHEASAALTPARRVAPAIVAVASVGAILLAAALALWFHYGTAVFFETIAAGFSACL
jgi:hypothetical protein